MKTIKHLFTALLLLCATVATAHDFEVDGIYYNITSSTDLTVEVTYKGYDSSSYGEYSGYITIPSTVFYSGEQYSVTYIGGFAFNQCVSLTSVTIPESVISIGDYAFYACWDLTSITIPEGVTSIGDYAFSGCSSLTSITIPESVTSIGDYAFSGCSSLYTIINYSNLYLIKGSSDHGEVAYYAKKVLNVKELITLNDFQFIKSNDIHYLVNYIGEDTEITLPENYNGNNYIISNYAFYDCSSLTSITIPESVTSIDDCAFSGCSGLTSITIPESVTSIGNFAFAGCISLKDLRIEDSNIPLELGANGSSYYYTGEGMFSVCPLETLYLGRNLSYKTSSNYGYSPFYNQDKLKLLIISNNVTSIGDYAFYGCSGLTSITIPESVTSIGDYAFYVCQNIHSLTINSGVVSIGSYAFSSPDKVIWLTNTPPEGYSHVEGRINYVANELYIFLNNVQVYPHLSSIFETDGVKYVPVSPSERICHAIDCAYDSTATTINVGETVLFQGVEMNVTEVKPFTFYDNSHIKNVYVSHSGNIGNQAFYNCSSLNNVTLGNNVSSLGNEAFYRCINLQEIVIPESIDTISESCFEGCSALANIDLGQGVNVINKYAFQDCSALSQISIPKGVIEIDNNVFKGCTALSDIIIEDRNEILSLGSNGTSALFVDCPLDSLYIGGNLSYETSSNYGYSPFYRNTSLRTVVITNKEDQIYDNEFYGCTNLKNVVIGHGVKSIGDYAFSGCSNLDGFSFGSNLKTIGAEAFSDCTNITSITSHAEVPPTCGEQALDDINKWTCVLKVPQNYASAYQAADQWKEFFYIEDVVEIELFTITYIVDDEIYSTEKYAVGDEITPEEEPTKEGYTFSGWSEIPETMPAEDVTVTGSFSINSYDLVYMIDGEEYKRVTLEFGSEIVPEEEPEKEGYTFSGWSEIPETMPSHDVEVTGSFIPTNVSEITAKVSLQINGNNISLSNANNSTVAIYSINGVLVKKIDKYTGEEITLEKGVYIVSVGDKAMKIIL